MSGSTAGDFLAAAAETYKERNAVYGNNHLRAAAILQGMFPDGIKIQDAAGFDRMHILFLIVVKLSRYAVAVERGESHQDSLRDLAVYAAILEEIDTNGNFFASEGEVEGRIYPASEVKNVKGSDKTSS